MPEFLSVFITTPTREEAEKIGTALVEARLAACVNIFPGISSIYRWEGKIEHAEECALIAKTAKDRFYALQMKVKELHSDKCPCIVATSIASGNPEYMAWLGQNCG